MSECTYTGFHGQREYRDVPKKPTSITITKDASTILTADKFGDVHRYPLHPASQDPADVPVLDMDDTENDALSTLVLGHTSLLTSLLLSPDEKFVVTADRDEHIRVSWFPEGYVIERYCLGHQKSVQSPYSTISCQPTPLSDMFLLFISHPPPQSTSSRAVETRYSKYGNGSLANYWQICLYLIS